jgi:biopolymer transport protein ExbB/TolQ
MAISYQEDENFAEQIIGQSETLEPSAYRTKVLAMTKEVFDLFRSDSAIPFVILALISVGWVIVIERFITLQFLYKINFGKFNLSMKKMLSAGDFARAKAFCQATSKIGLPLITARAIDAYESDAYRVRLVLSEESLGFIPKIRRRISQLPNLASAAVLLGALAAIHGVWQAFNTAEALELGVKTFAFTQGMSHSLTPLALAMVAAVLLVVPYGVLEAMAGRIESEFEHSLTVVLNILAPETQPVVAAVAAPAPSYAAKAPAAEAAAQKVDEKSIDEITNDIDKEVNSEIAEAVPDEEEII